MRNSIATWLKKAAEAVSADAPAGAETPDLQTAAAALLVEAARADEQYLDDEKAVIDIALGNLFELSPDAASALRAKGEAAQTASSGMRSFTRALVDGMAMEERIALIEGLWAVVLADDDREAHEITLMRRLAGLLYVSDHDSAAARRRAQTALHG